MMNVPKRFKLHEISELDGNPVQLMKFNGRSTLISFSNNCIAIVPTTEDLDVDLPFKESSDPDKTVIPLEAIKEAVKGKTGLGEIRFVKDEIRSRPSENKSWRIIEKIKGSIVSMNESVIHTLKKIVKMKSPKGYHYTEICLDAEVLEKATKVIGTSKVRLRFMVNGKTKIADGKHANVIHITPYRKDGHGEEAILSMLVTNK